ncbi:MAG: tRNA preQ1(34) S-adenosylmethionine ribosyltransferase-isomerase QueA [Candidatus Saccharibacteria bacterium]|nr:tRNA preQ1(34) S-adenosylmethionine ribosyltransferase-isomerase QueA [Candidatus Saccharibacteria bacterium]
MLVSDFNYNLPEEVIAQHPPKIRGTTRLLALNRKSGEITDSHYADLDSFLEPGDLIILNDTKVMRSRVFTERASDGHPRELVVLERHDGEIDHVMYRGKLHEGEKLIIKNVATDEKTSDVIEIQSILGNGIATAKGSRPLEEIAQDYGNVPLPPYMRRDAEPEDVERYQTVWAKDFGSAAAPTASLNMTKELLAKLDKKGVQIKYLTLHVGLGTFLPIRSDNVEEHEMHSEWFQIPEETLAAIKQTKEAGHRVIAVGTTVTRTLEFWGKTGKTEGEDNIFIYPGFEFKVIDALVTNFHAPKSTVLMLTAAFADWKNLKPAYDHAVESGYKLLSYGDSMFIY